MAHRNGNIKLDDTEIEQHMQRRQQDIAFCEAMAAAIMAGLERPPMIGMFKVDPDAPGSAIFVRRRVNHDLPGQWCIDG